MDPLPNFGLDELCALVDLPVRKIRYYIQMGVVDRPDGLNRGARYTTRHVEQLLSVKKWQAAGLSLERIRSLLHDETDEPSDIPRSPATIAVWSRIHLSRGLELHIEAGEAGLSPEELRALSKSILKAYRDIKAASATDTISEEGPFHE